VRIVAVKSISSEGRYGRGKAALSGAKSVGLQLLTLITFTTSKKENQRQQN
jgi:hypothetical protein